MLGYLITRLSIAETSSLQGWPDNLTGAKIHVAGSKSPGRDEAAAEFQSRGAIPVFMPNSEVAAALQSGTIDGSFYPPSQVATVDQILSRHDFYAYTIADDGGLALYAEGSPSEPTSPVPEGGTDGDDQFQSQDTTAGSRFDGKLGRDAVVYQGAREQYDFERGPDGSTLVTKPGGATDTLISIESLRFSDQSYNLEIVAKAALIPDATLNALVDLYIAYFNRVPEASGLGYWIDQFQAGQSLDQIAEQFYSAGVTFSSVTGYTADMPLSDFVTIVYSNVLDRTGVNSPSQAEIDYWLNQVNSGAVTREGLVKQVLTDARQFYDDPNVGYVPELLDRKVELGKLHAVTYGVDYLSSREAIATTVRVTEAVTPTSIEAAIDLIGLGSGDYIV